MTKEELELEFEYSFDANTRATGGGYEADTTDMNGLWRSFSPNIYEFAKEHSLAFAKYLMVDYKLSLNPESPILSDEEIYKLFITQKNENK